jgi:hypothetical protein
VPKCAVAHLERAGLIVCRTRKVGCMGVQTWYLREQLPTRPWYSGEMDLSWLDTEGEDDADADEPTS